jgi:glutamate--cysteine ligase
MDHSTGPPVETIDQLVAHFTAGCKPVEDQRIGVEHEKIGVLADGRAPGYDVILQIMEALSREDGWERVEERERLIALKHSGFGTITLEPGGQLERSGAPLRTAVEATHVNDRHLDEVIPIAAARGVSFLGIGFRPFGTLEEVPWMPKGRYRVMREYLPRRGALAHEMMKRTATVQANLDYQSEADAIHKLRLGLGLSSLVTSMFAASPLKEGAPSGYQSYRAACWLETDRDRCGIPSFMFESHASFRSYTEWALDVPMFFIYRRDAYIAVENLSFRRFMNEGALGEKATLTDWELHLSTLFPETRLKRYIEVRQADASNREMIRALPILWNGLLYDPDARAAAWALVSDWTMQERLDLYRRTPREGLRARVRNTTVRQLCAQLLVISKNGLRALGQPDSAALLEPLEQIVEEGRTVADRIVDLHAEANGDVARLIDKLRIQ